MINYETLMLARTEITDDELRALERQIDKVVSAKKGKVTLFDRWGKYKLAYPVKKNMYGIYVLARYQAPKEQIASLFDEIDTLFRIKYNEVIMRHVTVKLEDDVSSVYKYPESIGSHGTSNLDSFLKENKMGGLIDTPMEKSEDQEKETPAKDEVDQVEEEPSKKEEEKVEEETPETEETPKEEA